jgi:hypothetical protein
LLTFALSFHLPFYGLRRHEKPGRLRKDGRLFPDGEPLRHSEDISFLDRSSSQAVISLYEAQISCTVFGTNDRRWDATCLVDTYHEEEELGESVLDYHEAATVHGWHEDPLIMGTFEAGGIQDPREYFLRILHTRLKQGKSEWAEVVGTLQGSTYMYDQEQDQKHNQVGFLLLARSLAINAALLTNPSAVATVTFSSSPQARRRQ